MDILLQDETQIQAAKLEAQSLVSIALSQRQLCDLELILDGSFKPLKGFLNQVDYQRVVTEMRLSDGTLWPIPITLDIKKELASKLSLNQRVALRDAEGNLIALLTIESIWEANKDFEAKSIYGSTNDKIRSVFDLHHTIGSHYIGGSLVGVQLPVHYDFPTLRKTPNDVKAEISTRGWSNIIGFHFEQVLTNVIFNKLLEQLEVFQILIC